MEFLRDVKLTAEVDTNKWTEAKSFSLEEDEDVEELLQRFCEWVRGQMP